MSVYVLSGAWRESTLSGGPLLTLVALADQANDDGVTWWSQEQLAKKTRRSVAQIRRDIRAAEEAGELQTRRARRPKSRVRFNVYRLRWAAHEVDYDVLPFLLDEPFTTAQDERSLEEDDRSSGTVTTAHSYERQVVRESSGVSSETPGGEVSQETSSATFAAVGKAGGRDYLWDIFDREIGPVTNRDERGRRNRALKSIRESLYAWAADRDPNRDDGPVAVSGELVRRIRRFRDLYPGATLTETAIASNWRTLTLNVGRPAAGDPFACPDCARSFNSTLELREHREDEHEDEAA